jgi:hypothetical protein
MFEKLNKVEQYLFDALAVFLVLFYSYSAVLEPAATQYHRGIYVIITYALVQIQEPDRADCGLCSAAPVCGLHWLLDI